MKKVSILVIAMISICFAQNAFSQSGHVKGEVTPMKIGSTFLNLGLGVGADYKGENYGTAFGFKASAEFGLWQAGPGVITLGPEIGGTYSSEGKNGGSYQSNTFIIAGRSAWHFGWNVPGLDTYGGFSAGIGFHHYTYNNVNNNYSNQVIPIFGAFIGASYFITPTFGFNSEAGYDITNFQVGVVFKLQ
jgi:hypothetical protein